ncbi:WXG100 family type VII secretion target [Clostridium estertheticum]|uniref:WXG100 family type VII secretion target n=1 Tax=Clostridium estertheticum TaxID=238834 RepID=UPI001C0B53A8|nr:WXG100 family type VII secretion target [Clostridium estertheticum]MBU3215886.1 WXG100 family type VII secretion target [Clostridium estertheticum]WAG54126.1 WXG100 family type VII secretion target [Clostridium estertheticum]
MAKLKIDLNQLQQTALNYQQSIDEFTVMKKNLLNVIKDLEASGWVSGASTQYFSKFKDTWTPNMQMHIDILTHLKSCLTEAKTDYDDLYTDIPNLGSDL